MGARVPSGFAVAWLGLGLGLLWLSALGLLIGGRWAGAAMLRVSLLAWVDGGRRVFPSRCGWCTAVGFLQSHRERFLVNKRFRFVPAVAGGVLALVGSAQAAVPTAVTSALGDMQTDGVAVATLVLVAIIAIAAIKFIRKGM